ncbi:MAG: YitT family protein [Bacteroidetes bacterium]|nr:YitT family protein [Bacteroidota bacterium]
MNPIYQSLFINYAKSRAKKKGQIFRRAGKQDYKSFKRHARSQFIDGFLIIAGMLSAGLGLKGFLLPNGFIDGGVMGISLLISEITGWSLSFLIVIINLPFIYLGLRQINKVFALKTLSAIGGLALCLYFIPYPILTSDKLLVSVFGGFFLGVGIGLAMRCGGVIDGTEILALSITRKSVLTIGDVILIINIIIFCVAAFVLSFEQALYSILTYISAAKTVDYIISGIEEYTGVTIISERSDEIRKMITEQLGRGVTVYRGKGGYGSHGHQLSEVDIVFSVVTRLEMSTLKAEVDKIDQKAFLITHSIKDTKGGMIKKRHLV